MLIFIDEIYNNKVKLIIQSSVQLEDLFDIPDGKVSEEIFMASRCLSRLMEIQTEPYLKMKHQFSHRFAL